MGKNKKTRLQIASLEKQRAAREMAIINEKSKESPDRGLIRHWEKEIAVWDEKIKQLERRLGRDW